MSILDEATLARLFIVSPVNEIKGVQFVIQLFCTAGMNLEETRKSRLQVWLRMEISTISWHNHWHLKSMDMKILKRLYFFFSWVLLIES